MENFFLYSHTKPYDSAVDVWKESPNRTGVFVYSVLTPSICLLGVVGNFFCLLVLNTSKLKCSFYVYLTVIASVDLASCVIIFLSGLSRGIFWEFENWSSYDTLIYSPLVGVLSCVSTIATVFVTIDRLVYLKRPTRRFKPKLCKRNVAWMITFIGTIVSIILMTPYCFIYKVTEDGYLNTTSFYQSTFYAVYNWLDVIIFAILPLAILSIGNAMLIMSIKKAFKKLKYCNLVEGRARKMKDQTKITATLIATVILYMIGEVPTHFVSMKTAANILFGGDDERANESIVLEVMRQVTTVLNACHLTIKFVLYALFCPPFHKALKNALLPKPLVKRSVEVENEPVKVYVIDNVDNSSIRSTEKRVRFDVRELGFMNLFVNLKSTQELPRLL